MSPQNLYQYAVGHEEAVQLVMHTGDRVTHVFEGEPGCSKSSILKTLRTRLGDAYDYIYADLPTFDIPDIALSMPNHDTRTTMPYVNDLWLGTDPKKPKVVMLDEVFKVNDHVRLMANRAMLERVIGSYHLPAGSLLFATTNFSSDGVGDRTSAHTNSRVARLMFRKPTVQEWTAWANDNGINPIVITWANQNPIVFKSYKDTAFDAGLHKNGQGPFRFIFHPTENNTTYVCPRTLELASHELNRYEQLGASVIQKVLIGIIGVTAALDMMTYMQLSQDLPHPDDIVKSPESARVPANNVAKLMLMFKSLQYITPETLPSYVTYMNRLGAEIMATWVKTMVSSSQVKTFALMNQDVRRFAIANSWLME